VQLFNALIIQFETFNASELRTRGLEGDFQYITPIDGLSLRGNLALTETTYEDSFVNATGQDLEGQDGALSPDVAGAIGFTWDVAISAGWRMDLSADLRYSDDYFITATANPFRQKSFWITDAALRFFTEDYRYELAFIGRNLGDKIYAQGAGSRPGACANNQALIPFGCDLTATANDQDQVTTTSLGRQYQVQFKVRF
jgi:iron complex outermembrane receptor protein